MKNVFGRILILLLLCSVYVYADDPNIPPSLNEDNECGVPMGVITAWTGPDQYNYYVVGSHPDGGYYAKARTSADSASIGYGSYRVDWSGYNKWVGMPSSSYSLDACQQAYLDYVSGLNGSDVLLDPQAVYDGYFPPESRYDLTADDDGDGMLDYYDLDCPRYDEYLAYCEAANVEPLDLVDYQYFQDNDIADWLGERMDITDTDGDGFSDGYERIHGTEVYDGADYPLGIPDTGSSNLIVGGVNEKEPWRLEQYNDSGYSRGYIYDQGYDPFGEEALTFEDDPDWGLLDSDNDGLVNYAELANGTDPYRFEFQSGFSYIYNEDGGYYSVTGYTEDGAFGDYSNPPTQDEYMDAYEDYEVGNYGYNPSEYAFGDDKYDGLLSKTSKIKFNYDNVRPQNQRDYKLYFSLPIPGLGMQSFGISVMPDTSTPAGVAMEIVRQLIRGMSAVVFSYVFIKHIWLVIRQY